MLSPTLILNTSNKQTYPQSILSLKLFSVTSKRVFVFMSCIFTNEMSSVTDALAVQCCSKSEKALICFVFYFDNTLQIFNVFS